MQHNVYLQPNVKYRRNAFPSQGTYRLKDPTGAPCVIFDLPSRRGEYDRLREAIRAAATDSQQAILISGDYGAGKTAALGALHERGPSIAGMDLGNSFMSVFFDCPTAAAIPELAIHHLVNSLVDEILDLVAERLRANGWTSESIDAKFLEPRHAVRRIQQKEYAPEWFLALHQDHRGSELLSELIRAHASWIEAEFLDNRSQEQIADCRQNVMACAEGILQHLDVLKRQGHFADVIPSRDEVVQNARFQPNERPNPAQSFQVFSFIVRWVLVDPDVGVDHLHLYVDEVEKVINSVSADNREAIARFFQDILELREGFPEGKHLFIALAMTTTAVDDLIQSAPALQGRRLLPTINLDPLSLDDLVLVVQGHLRAALKDNWTLAGTEPFSKEAINTAYRYGNAVLGNVLRPLHVAMQWWYGQGHDDDSRGEITADSFFDALQAIGIVTSSWGRAIRSYSRNERKLLEYIVARPTYDQAVTASSDDEELDEEEHAFHLRELAERFHMTVNELEGLLGRVHRNAKLSGLFIRGGSQNQYVWVSMTSLHEGFLNVRHRTGVSPVRQPVSRRGGQADPAFWSSDVWEPTPHANTTETTGRQDGTRGSSGGVPVSPEKSAALELVKAAQGDRFHTPAANYERGLLRLMRYRWHRSNTLRHLSLENESSWIPVANRLKEAAVPHADLMLGPSGPVGDVVLCSLAPNQSAGNQDSVELIHSKVSVLLLPLKVVEGDPRLLDVRYHEFISGSVQALADFLGSDAPVLAVSMVPEGDYAISSELQQLLESGMDSAPPWVRNKHKTSFLSIRVNEKITFEGESRQFRTWIAYLGGLDFDVDTIGDESLRGDFLADTKLLWGQPTLRDIDFHIARSCEVQSALVPFVPVRNGFIREGQAAAEGVVKLVEPVVRAVLDVLTVDRHATLTELHIRARELYKPDKDVTYVKPYVQVALNYLVWAGLIKSIDQELITLDRAGANQLVAGLPSEFTAEDWDRFVIGVPVPARGRKADQLVRQLLNMLHMHNVLTMDEGSGLYRHATRSFSELQSQMLGFIATLRSGLSACDLLGRAPLNHQHAWERLAELAGQPSELDIAELREVSHEINRSVDQLNLKLGSWAKPLAALTALTHLDVISKPAQALTLLAGLAPFRHFVAGRVVLNSWSKVHERLGLSSACGLQILQTTNGSVSYSKLSELLNERMSTEASVLNLLRAQPNECIPPEAANLPWGQVEEGIFSRQLGEALERFSKRGLGSLAEAVDRIWTSGTGFLMALLDASNSVVAAMEDLPENKERLEQALPSISVLIRSLDHANTPRDLPTAAGCWTTKLGTLASMSALQVIAEAVRTGNLTPRLSDFGLNAATEADASSDASQAISSIKQFFTELIACTDVSRWQVSQMSDLYVRAAEYLGLKAWTTDDWLLRLLADEQRMTLISYPESGTTAVARDLLQKVKDNLRGWKVRSYSAPDDSVAREFCCQVADVLAGHAVLERGLALEVQTLMRQCQQRIENCENRIQAIQILGYATSTVRSEVERLRPSATVLSNLHALPHLRSRSSKLDGLYHNDLWNVLIEAAEETVPCSKRVLDQILRPGFSPSDLDHEERHAFEQLKQLGLVKSVSVWQVS